VAWLRAYCHLLMGNVETLLRVGRVFDGPLGVAYAAWFN
jgi:hypothetical protein